MTTEKDINSPEMTALRDRLSGSIADAMNLALAEIGRPRRKKSDMRRLVPAVALGCVVEALLVIGDDREDYLHFCAVIWDDIVSQNEGEAVQ